MDVPLEELAEVSAAIGRGEEAVEEQAWETAREAVDAADHALELLRDRWRDLDDRGRQTLGALATPLRARRDQLATRIPAPRAVSEGAPVHDPEQDDDPEPGAAPA
ncbi:hypothetical protein [Patulibacter defluvii]|uniref:hypothetical protein n=1 Tax=Patulibacter defluvii TaxID=3095358 RepID=UPI002A747445|nr:hypothetical protein [Patulibacter sp. DM4]